MTILYKKIECPYCGVEQRVGGDHGETKIVRCDNEIGGCDEAFSIFIWYKVEITTFKMSQFRKYSADEESAKGCDAPEKGEKK